MNLFHLLLASFMSSKIKRSESLMNVIERFFVFLLLFLFFNLNRIKSLISLIKLIDLKRSKTLMDVFWAKIFVNKH